MSRLLALFFLPPLNFFFLFLLGIALRPRRRRLGNAFIGLGAALYVLCSVPGISIAMINALEDHTRALTAEDPRVAAQADAIVVLGAGRVLGAPEFGGGNTVQKGAFERLRFAERLAKASGKPVLLTGGSPGGAGESEAELMKDVMERDFTTPVKWIETRSVNTMENARYSAQILLPLGIKRIVLVTHAAHMKRALYSFERVGFMVLPAPVSFLSTEVSLADPKMYLPSPQAMAVASDVFHEWIGLLWYKFRF